MEYVLLLQIISDKNMTSERSHCISTNWDKHRTSWSTQHRFQSLIQSTGHPLRLESAEYLCKVHTQLCYARLKFHVQELFKTIGKFSLMVLAWLVGEVDDDEVDYDAVGIIITWLVLDGRLSWNLGGTKILVINKGWNKPNISTLPVISESTECE